MVRYSIAYLGNNKWACIELTPDDAPIAVDSDGEDEKDSEDGKTRLEAVTKQMEELEKEKERLGKEKDRLVQISPPAKKIKVEKQKTTQVITID